MVSITPSRRLLVNCVQVWFDSHISLIYVLISQSFYLKLSLIHGKVSDQFDYNGIKVSPLVIHSCGNVVQVDRPIVFI